MLRYNNISRPVHDPYNPPATSLTTPCPKSGGLTPLDTAADDSDTDGGNGADGAFKSCRNSKND